MPDEKFLEITEAFDNPDLSIGQMFMRQGSKGSTQDQAIFKSKNKNNHSFEEGEISNCRFSLQNYFEEVTQTVDLDSDYCRIYKVV